MPKYRLKILCDIDLPVRDDPTARQEAYKVLSEMGIDPSLARMDQRPVTVTLVSEDSRDGRNILNPPKV